MFIKYKILVFSLAFLVTMPGLAYISGCIGSSTQPGTLKGTVKIGPIFPVERPGFNPPVSPQVFESRKVMVYDQRGIKLLYDVNIYQIDQSAAGRYLIELKPGKYTVDIKHIGIDRSSEVPKIVEIKQGEVTILDVNIDTGIR